MTALHQNLMQARRRKVHAVHYKKIPAAIKKAERLKTKIQEAEPIAAEPDKAEKVIEAAAETATQAVATSGYGGWFTLGLGLAAIIGGIVCAATGYGAVLALPLISAGIGLISKGLADKKVGEDATAFYNTFKQKAAAVAAPKLAMH